MKNAAHLATLLTAAPAINNWAYDGMDPNARVHVNFDATSCLPALIVWLTLTTNPSYLGDSFTDAESQAITDGTGMTATCIQYIRNSYLLRGIEASTDHQAYTNTQVQNAFQIVALAFHNMGVEFAQPAGEEGALDDDYVPENCPLVGDMTALTNAAGASVS